MIMKTKQDAKDNCFSFMSVTNKKVIPMTHKDVGSISNKDTAIAIKEDT